MKTQTSAPSVSIPIAIVRLGAIGFALFGLAYLAAPQTMAALLGIQLTMPSAIGDVRASYGGLPIALGIFLWLCARPERVHIGALLMMLTGVGLADSRLLSLVLDGAPNAAAWTLFAIETGTALLGFVAMRLTAAKQNRQTSAQPHAA
jgi:hypothetical protein